MDKCKFDFMENGVYADVLADMRARLTSGTSMQEATTETLEEFCFEAEDFDDFVYVYLAIAQAQLEKGRILKKTKTLTKKAIESYTRYLESGTENTPEAILEITASLQDFAQKMEKPLKPFKDKKERIRCEWKLGDTYAFCLECEEAKKLGLEGHWFLMRMADIFKLGADQYACVYLSITNGKTLPQTPEELEDAIYLRCNEQNVYQLVLRSEPEQRIENAGLTYVGNFPNMPVIKDEKKKDGLYLFKVWPDQIPEKLLWLITSSYTNKKKLQGIINLGMCHGDGSPDTP